ncbi:MAG: 5'-3' exonuclease H3TH domain-containing protein [Polyangiaceae bacterium]
MALFLVDGTYELFRAYFGAPPKTAPDGREIGAVRGVVASLLGMLRHEGATHVGVATDHVIESFRNDLFPHYKTGEGMDPRLYDQFPILEDLLRAAGFVVWAMVEFEADDAIAAAAHKFDAEAPAIRLATVDKDLAQCVRGERVIMVDRRRKQTLDEKGVKAKFGVPPALIPDWLALVGDSADGYPGIPGWGAKTAAAVLSVHGPIEAIPDDPSAWRATVRGKETIAAALAARREEAMLYKRLATLRTDAPIPETLAELEWKGPRPGGEALFSSLGLDDLFARYAAAARP